MPKMLPTFYEKFLQLFSTDVVVWWSAVPVEVPQWEGLCKKIYLTMTEFVTLEMKDAKKEESTSGGSSSRWMYFDYKYMNEWFPDQHSLLKTVSWKHFGFPERGGSVSTIWIGNDGAHTPCHLDTYGCNLVAQVYGRKQWILFPSEKTSSLSPTRIPYEESSIYSNLNFYSPDPNIANELQEAYVVTLKPGDVLFVPRHWWHYVENVGVAVSINSWIPLLSDDESRLEESLVRFFVSNVCKDLPECRLHQLLNPNEVELVNDSLALTGQQVEICLAKYQQTEDCSTKLDVDVVSERGYTGNEKRPRLDGKSDLCIHGHTSASNKLTQEEVFHSYKDVISVVPKYSVSEFRDLLTEKLKSFCTQDAEGLSWEGSAGTMTSIIKLHAISGAMDESPPCYLLQVDDFRILLDCGWNENFDQEFMKELRRFVHQIDAVLLSYPDPLHLGALPYLVGKCGLNCPIYATIPVYKMGQMFMYDLYQSRHNMEEFELFTLDDVDAAFDKIIQLKYNQSVPMKGKGYGLTITPLPAGHMIGGTIWKIVKVGEEDIVYAVDFNHKKERHLNGCELERLQRPSLLITDAFNATYQQARRRARDEKLMTNILQTLRNNGNVLVTVDTAGRVLELAHMLDQLWRNKDSGLLAYSLALLNNVSYNVVEFAKSQIEWMSDKLMRTFEGARNNPFQFKHLQLCHSIAELSRVPSPKVVLASTPDMECGFSRELFLQWSSNPHNSIIITNRTSPGTLARQLIENGGKLPLNLEIRRRVRLEGAELEEYQRKERESKEKGQEKNEDVDMSDESEDEMDSLSAVAKGKHDLLVKTETKVQTGFFKSNKKQYPMFPFFEEKVKFDEYGEIIRPEDYKMIDSNPEAEDNKENVDLKEEEIVTADITELPTKCISVMKTVRVMAQVQYIDFEGRSDGESLQKILGQLRPRRLILVRGTPDSTHAMLNHCRQWAGARVFAPSHGEVVDATTETHIYQVRLTDALVSALELKKGKDAELAWLDAQIMIRDMSKDAKPIIMSVNDNEKEEEKDKMEIDQIYTLEPLPLNQVAGHQTAFINELKLSDFKQVLNKNSIPSEFSGGVLWCCNGTIAVRRHEAGRVILEGCLSDDYYRVRELLYEQYAIV